MSNSSPPHYADVKAVQTFIGSSVQALLFQSFFSGAANDRIYYHVVLIL